MADIDAEEFVENTQQTYSADTNYATVMTVAAANWVANAKYLVFLTARIDGSSATIEFGHKLNRATGGDIADSEQIGEALQHYSWWGIYDVPGTAEDILYRFKSFTGGGEVRSDAVSLLKVRLDADLTENTDWRFAEDTNDTNPEATYTTFANIASYTPGTPANDRLILALIRVGGSSTDKSHLWHLEENINGAGFVEVGGEMSIEGETSGEFRMYVIAWVDDSGTSGTREYRIQMKNEDTDTNNTHVYSSLFVLELDAFVDHDQALTTTPLAGDNGVQVLNTIANYAPAVTGNQVFLNFAQADPDSVTTWRAGAIEQDDVNSDNDWEAQITTRSHDSTDKRGTFRSRIFSVASSGEKLEQLGFGLNTGNYDERSLIVFSLALAPVVAVPRFIRSRLQSRKGLEFDSDRLVSTGLISAGKST